MLMKHTIGRALLSAGFLTVACAANADEAATLRNELQILKADYERRLQTLENRIQNPELAKSKDAPSANTPARSSLNPDVSLILQGQYANMKDVPGRAITGFWPSSEESALPARGFSINHSELVLESNADPFIRGRANLAIVDGSVEVEEAWLQTLALGRGFSAKAGRLRSGIGYLNEQHPHQWDFADAPLIQQAMFGVEGYKQEGVQLKWLAPTPMFIELGAEAGRGAAFPGTDRNKNGIGGGALFAHTGGDVGASHSWRAGISYLRSQAAAREVSLDAVGLADGPVLGAFSGSSKVWGADVVWKWAPDGNPRTRHVKFQAEYFQRREDGEIACGVAEANCGALAPGGYASRQSGWYAQGVWQFMPQWRTGLRMDRLDSGSATLGGAAAPGYKPKRDTVMVDFSPSEFSRFRLQFARDNAMQGVTDNQVWLQYIISLGAHGAHKF